MTDEQIETLNILLDEQGRVLDRVYFDHTRKSINFRAPFTITGAYNSESNRLAIMPNGTIVNRNTHRAFSGILA